MPKQPLAEVFGYPITNFDKKAERHRGNCLCPFNNKVPNCTKDKVSNPLGVCSLFSDNDVVITCPVRFRENWIIADDAAEFFFPADAKWTTHTEVRLTDKHGKSAGNIDVVLISYNDKGKVTDFGALEVQAVYISGNVRNPFEHYMKNPMKQQKMDWSDQANYPRPDYLSSSRKRLAPQLLFKGGIFKAWDKKTAVALNKGFFETLPELTEVPKNEADIVWLVYDLVFNTKQNVYKLERCQTQYTRFHESLQTITQSDAGDINEFMQKLQEKVSSKLNNPPDTETIDAEL